MILQPILRYIPERAVMQRLIWRAVNMKDDLEELKLEGEMDMGGETVNNITGPSGIGAHLTESPDIVGANNDSP